MKVSNQLEVLSALSSGKQLPVPIVQEALSTGENKVTAKICLREEY
jgi:hypothetical protein